MWLPCRLDHIVERQHRLLHTLSRIDRKAPRTYDGAFVVWPRRSLGGLLVELWQPLQLRRHQPAILLLPVVIGRQAETVQNGLPAEVSHLCEGHKPGVIRAAVSNTRIPAFEPEPAKRSASTPAPAM